MQSRFPSLLHRQNLNSIGLFFLLSVMLLLTLPTAVALPVLFVVAAGYFSYQFWGKKERAAALFAVLGIALAMILTGVNQLTLASYEKEKGQESLLEGVVLSQDEDGYDLLFYRKADRLTLGRARVQGEREYTEGQRLKVSARLLGTPPREDLADGVQLLAQEQSAVFVGEVYLLSAIASLRAEIGELLGEGEGAAFLKGILLGETEEISKERREAFRQTGTSHLLAISGLHFSLWISFFYGFFRFFRLPRRPLRIMMLVLTLALMLFMGAGVSVLRAAVMTAVTLLSSLFRERRDSFTALVFAALILLCACPWAIFDLSFVFSFTATFSIVSFSAPLMWEVSCLFWSWEKKRWWDRTRKKICLFVLSIFFLTAGVFVFSFPAQVFLLGEAQFLSPLYAVLLLPLFSLTLFFSILFLFLLPLLSLFPEIMSFCLSVFDLFPRLVEGLASASPELMSLEQGAVFPALVLVAVIWFLFVRRRPLSDGLIVYAATVLFCLPMALIL